MSERLFVCKRSRSLSDKGPDQDNQLIFVTFIPQQAIFGRFDPGFALENLCRASLLQVVLMLSQIVEMYDVPSFP
jgi:hypothetical protein